MPSTTLERSKDGNQAEPAPLEEPVFISQITGALPGATPQASRPRRRLPIGWYDAGVVALILATAAAFLISLIRG